MKSHLLTVLAGTAEQAAALDMLLSEKLEVLEKLPETEKEARKLLRTLRRADKGQMRTKCILRAVQNRLEEHDEFGALSGTRENPSAAACCSRFCYAHVAVFTAGVFGKPALCLEHFHNGSYLRWLFMQRTLTIVAVPRVQRATRKTCS